MSDRVVETRQAANDAPLPGREAPALEPTSSRGSPLGELRAFRARLQAILEALNDAVAVLDFTGAVVYVNAAARALLGIENPRTLLGRPLEVMYAARDVLSESGARLSHEELPGRELYQGSPRGEVLLRLRDPTTFEERCAVVRTSPIVDEDRRIVAVVKTFRDVTAEQISSARLELLARAGATLPDRGRTSLDAMVHIPVPLVADACFLDLLEEPDRWRRVAAAASGGAMPRAEFSSTVGETFGLHAFARAGQAQRLDDPDDAILAPFFGDGPLPSAVRSIACVPLMGSSSAFGALTLASFRRRLDDSDLALAHALARMAAETLENRRLYEFEQRARIRWTKLQQVTAALSRAETPEDVADASCRTGIDVMGAVSGTLWIRGADGALRLAGCHGVPESFIREFAVLRPGDDAPALAVAESGQPLWVETEVDYRKASPLTHARAAGAGRLMSYAAVPVVGRTGVQGVLAFGHAPFRRFDQDDRAFYLAVAQQCAQALERARLLDEARRSAARLEVLVQAGAALSTSLDDQTMLRNAVASLVPAVADVCAVTVRDAAGRTLSLSSAADARVQGAVDEAPDWACFAEEIGELVARVDDGLLRRIARDARHRGVLDRLAPRSLLRVPLASDRGIEGELTLCYGPSKREYTRFDLDLAHELSRRIVVAVENATLYREAQAAAAAARAAADDAARASRAKDEFLAMLGHELRNPLAPIVTALQLMKLQGEGSFLRERAILDRQVRHLGRLVDDLLDVARITAGRIELARRRVELSTIVAQGVETAIPLIEERRQHLTIAVPERLCVEGDPDRLAQVVSNLVVNASKYTPPGGRIRVDAVRANGAVRVLVEDDGNGIDAELLPRVFDIFTQGRQALDRRTGGLGLGLAIVRSIVELHGGTVAARSDGPGKGSVFELTLPLAEGEGATFDAGAREDRPRPSTRAHVLLVDDNQDAAELLDIALASFGFVATRASDAAAALALLRDVRPDVAVLDIGLPGMDGLELARRIRAIPHFAALPLVALTGYGQASDRARTREAGFDAHLVKPVDIDELERTLSDLLAARAVVSP